MIDPHLCPVQADRSSPPAPAAEEEESVVQFSRDQRVPREGEPVCVICGKYGAYVPLPLHLVIVPHWQNN
jgi:hypothetical protein